MIIIRCTCNNAKYTKQAKKEEMGGKEGKKRGEEGWALTKGRGEGRKGDREGKKKGG